DREMTSNLGPGANAHPVGLLDAAGGEGMQRWLAIAPAPLLERSAQLWLMGFAHQISRLVIKGGVQEEALVGEPERLAGFANSALTESYELLPFGKRTNGDSPFFESNWHRK